VKGQSLPLTRAVAVNMAGATVLPVINKFLQIINVRKML